MSTNLFNPDILINNSDVSESVTNETNEGVYLFPYENYDNIFEILQGELKDIEDFGKKNDSGFFEDIPICKTEEKRTNILGEYSINEKHIKYYKQTPDILEITKIHERFHALHHLTKDVNGFIWNDFSSTPSFYKELLAQLFTYIFIRDNNNKLLSAFNTLNDTQPIIYQTYKIFQHYNQKQAEDLYWIIRNNVSNNIILKTLQKMAKYLKVNTCIVNKPKVNTCIVNKPMVNTCMINNPKINEHLVKALTFICKNPLIFVSETDIHQLVMRELMTIDELNPDKILYETDCTIGSSYKGISPQKYKTMLIHKEYGHASLRYSRSDIVILNSSDVKDIDDPINLKSKGEWLTPDYIFEFGTEKSANSVEDFAKHLKNDLCKVAEASEQGYLIHIQRNYQKLGGKTHEKNIDKFDSYVKKYNNVLNDCKINCPYGISISKIKIVFIVIDIGGDGREVRGKVRLLKNPFSSDCKLYPINLKNISKELSLLLK
jgi:hypothetical protein